MEIRELAQTIRHIHRFTVDRNPPRWVDDWMLRSHLDLQLTNDPLLSAEQMSIGGPLSVRGVSRNLLVETTVWSLRPSCESRS